MHIARTSPLRLLGAALLALALTSCGGGGGGGGGTASGGSSGGGGGGGGTNVTRTFQVNNFGGAQVATAVISHRPSGTSAASTSLTASNREGAAGRVEVSARTEVEGPALSRDMPVEVEAAERVARESVLQRKGGAALRAGEVSPRFGDAFVTEGQDLNFFIATTGQTVACRKMHSDGDTTSLIAFAEVVSGNPVINKTTALTVDARFGITNPFDPNGTPIYNRVRNTFGTEWTTNPTGGRDGDTKIIFVFLSSNTIGGANLFGFYRPNDEFSTADVPNSNQGEILYVNATHFTGDMYDGLATVAHEFQHMCNFNQKFIRNGQFNGSDENDTINEGFSVLAEAETGFDLDSAGGGNSFMFSAARAYLLNPTNFPFFQFANANGDYGKGYLMSQYIRDRFGLGDITAAATSTGTGANNLAGPTGLTFNQLFQDWALTNLLDPVTGAPGQFTYSSIDTDGTYNIRGAGLVSLPGVTASQTLNPPNGSLNLNLSAWTAGYLRMAGGDGSALNVSLSVPSTSGTGLVVESPSSGTFGSIQQQ